MQPKPASASQEVHFQHVPLDLNNQTIRLVKISGQLTRDGLIHCQMKHVNLNNASKDRLSGPDYEENQPSGASNEGQSEESYTCLSYTWGNPSPEYLITIDRKPYHVRKNLWEFLDTVRTWEEMNEAWFWIDAMCIDQQNNLERNHQVQQMGRIYSQAGRVITWLGRTPELESVLQFANAYDPYDTYQSLSQYLDRRTTRSFCCHIYWSRAWITQEVALAKRVDVVAGTQTTELKRLMNIIGKHVTKVPFRSITDYIKEQDFANPLYNENLFRTVHQFRHTKCVIPRDRIYSLLALCKEGGKLKIDYDASEEQVMRQILEEWPASLCFCAAAIVADALWSRASTVPLVEDTTPYVEVTVLVSQSTSQNACANCYCSLPLEWTSTEGLIICFQGICGDMFGHLFWQEGSSLKSDIMFPGQSEDKLITGQWLSSAHAEIECLSVPQGLILQDTDYNIEFDRRGARKLRLSFRALFNMVSNNQRPRDIQRNCRNVWMQPSPRLRPTGMRFCHSGRCSEGREG